MANRMRSIAPPAPARRATPSADAQRRQLGCLLGAVIGKPAAQRVLRDLAVHRVRHARAMAAAQAMYDAWLSAEAAHAVPVALAGQWKSYARADGSPRRADETRTHCRAGHLYDAANTYRDKRGTRRCLTCKRAHLGGVHRSRRPADRTADRQVA